MAKKLKGKCEKCGEIHTLCNAHRKRKNTNGIWVACKRYPSKGRDNCYLHGGATPQGLASPHFKTGERSRVKHLPRNAENRVSEMIEPILDQLELSFRILLAFETRFYEKLSTNESTAAWKKLQTAVSKYQSAGDLDNKDTGAAKQAKAFAIIKLVTEEGMSESFLMRDILIFQEAQRKLAETISKIRKEEQETYTQEEWNDAWRIVVKAILDNVRDRKTLTAIQQQVAWQHPDEEGDSKAD